MNEKTKKRIYGIVLPIISTAIIIVVLFAASAIVDDRLVLPDPGEIFSEFCKLFTTKAFYGEIFGNLSRTLASFALAFVLACILAISAATNDIVDKMLYPLVSAVRAVPTMALILWFLIVFKSDKSPMAVAFTVIFPMLYSAVYGAIKNRDVKLDEMARVFGVPKKKILFKIIIPDVAKRLFSQFCTTLSFTVKLIVAGEALAYTKTSLGKELQLASANLETAKLLALTVAVIILSLLLEGAIKGVVYLIRRISYGYNRRKLIEKIR